MTSKDWRPTAFVETTPGIIGEEEADAGRVEQRKAIYEFVRHLMTLDTTVLVLTAALVDRAFAAPLHRQSVGIAVGALLASLLAGGVAYLYLVAHHPRAGAQRASRSDRVIAFTALALTFAGFIVGVGELGWFFLANWFR